MKMMTGAVGKLKGKTHRVGSGLGEDECGVGMGIAGIVPGRAIFSIHEILDAP